MNDLAKRIYDGQSISLPEKERLQRILLRLEERGYTKAEIKKLKL